MKATLQHQNLNEQQDFWILIKTKPTNILRCDTQKKKKNNGVSQSQ